MSKVQAELDETKIILVSPSPGNEGRKGLLPRKSSVGTVFMAVSAFRQVGRPSPHASEASELAARDEGRSWEPAWPCPPSRSLGTSSWDSLSSWVLPPTPDAILGCLTREVLCVDSGWQAG